MLELDPIRQYARSFFEENSGCHGWEHTERVLALARRIAVAEGADLDVVSASALLHDIGRREESASNGACCHAAYGAELAGTFLESLAVDRDVIQRIVHCIAAHRFRNSLHPETLEARILFDADKLDSIGAVGIGRAFQFAGEVGARLHDPAVDPATTRPYSIHDTAYREYLVKLRYLKDRMLTASGRRLAKERSAFMDAFFARLNDEVAGEL
ncbi:MAG: HD domain-containing protein [Acidobacteria bacterium]|nr:HD domain-containing protein [Acidobacteriota bacterium]